MASKEELKELENLTNELVGSLNNYRTEISNLENQIKELKKKEQATEDQLKKLQEASSDKQKELDEQKATASKVLEKLKEAKEETVKLDAQFLAVKDLFK